MGAEVWHVSRQTCDKVHMKVDHKEKSVTPTIQDAELTEILGAVGKYDSWLWCSWSCDVWHMPKKRTAVAVQYGYPLGKLVSLGSPRNLCFLWALKVVFLLRV